MYVTESLFSYFLLADCQIYPFDFVIATTCNAISPSYSSEKLLCCAVSTQALS